MAEPKVPPPHAGERLTREDVLRLIEEHGGPEGLDLREADLRQCNLVGVDLCGADLSNVDLREADLQEVLLARANLKLADFHQAGLQGAEFELANLRGANLEAANLQRAILRDANLEGAILSDANLEGADLSGADLRGAHLADANLRDTNLENVNWGDYRLDEELSRYLTDAPSVYRTLKRRHTEAGMYDIAGEFFYREMEARRKLAWKERRLPYALGMYLWRFLFGYGERPERVIGWAAAIIFGLALLHWGLGTVSGGLPDALYYSAVSFTALGYGAWAPEPQGWAGRFLGVGEALMGVFMMALFLVTFTRKMTR